MRVFFEGETAQYFPGEGIALQPGVNEDVDDAKVIRLAGAAVVVSGKSPIRLATPAEISAHETAKAEAVKAAAAAETKRKHDEEAHAKASAKAEAATRAQGEKALGLAAEKKSAAAPEGKE